ncbi:hypothetical protein Aspvir_000567 [Aspergillus viridinutans]|uniref:Uncharacterized protein n=1 Tax=Aspergillus viridinutans TaxID=75553 RepID=A0A9P3F1U5_ASPVI|nr:uncharacterized protein Aspvir_000567 [Aspergillus viridinutans]GIJ98450.1 hypothetical protein Aspvir_000567 [Aspergillus viridinutans]
MPGWDHEYATAFSSNRSIRSSQRWGKAPGKEMEKGQDGKPDKSASPGPNDKPDETVERPEEVMVINDSSDDSGSQDNGTDIGAGRWDP